MTASPRTPAARLLLAAVVLVAALPAGTAAAPAPVPAEPRLQSQPAVDNTVTRVELAPNGSARWTVRIRTRLDTEEGVENYRAFQEEFRANTSRFLGPFRDRMERVVGNAANVTGREMTAGDFEAATSVQEVPRRWGVVRYSFTWRGFAATDGDRVVVGDVFEGGFFLAEADRLEVAAPDGYRVVESGPAPDDDRDGVVGWLGRRDFADRRPRVVVAPATATPTTDTTDGNGTDATTSDPGTATTGDDRAGGPGVVLLLGGGVLVVALGVGGYLLRRRREDDGPNDPGATAGDRDGSPPTAVSGGGDGPGDDASGAGLVTDEERVRELLAANGGRMRQADVAEALDWSASKTSRTIADMAEAGTVEKLRLGRENVVDLVDTDRREK